MKEEYNEELLSKIDNVVEKLKERKDLANEEIQKDEYEAYYVLEKEKWAKISYLFNDDINTVSQSDTFMGKLAGGKFSEQYRREKRSSSSVTITANNSNVAFGSNITQSLNISNYDTAIKEIEQTDKLTEAEKIEITELFNDLKDAQANNQSVGKKLLRQLAKWSSRIGNIGLAVASIYRKYQPQIDLLIDSIK